jgi:hypothetical protein
MPCQDRLSVSDIAGEHIVSGFRIKQSTLLGLRDPEDGVTRLIRNVRSYLPVDAAYLSDKLEWRREFQISHGLKVFA